MCAQHYTETDTEDIYEDFPKNMDSSLAYEFSIEMVDIVLLLTGMSYFPYNTYVRMFLFVLFHSFCKKAKLIIAIQTLRDNSKFNLKLLRKCQTQQQLKFLFYCLVL